MFQAEAPQATASEELAQGPYVAARAGFKQTTRRTKGDESTNELAHPTPHCFALIEDLLIRSSRLSSSWAVEMSRLAYD